MIKFWMSSIYMHFNLVLGLFFFFYGVLLPLNFYASIVHQSNVSVEEAGQQ
jgi:hypothetical protein